MSRATTTFGVVTAVTVLAAIATIRSLRDRKDARQLHQRLDVELTVDAAAAVGRRGSWGSALLSPAVGRVACWVPASWVARVDDAGLAVDGARLVASLGLAALAGMLLTALLAGVVASVSLGGALVLAAASALVVTRGRADRLVERELPTMLDLLAAALRAGVSVRQALDEVVPRLRAPLRDDLLLVRARCANGSEVIEALDAWRRARPLRAVASTVVALHLALDLGSAGAPAIDGIASTQRDAVAVRRELAVLSTQARVSALVIVLAPLGFLAVTGISDTTTVSFLLTTTPGLLCLATGLALDAIGALWMVWLAREVS